MMQERAIGSSPRSFMCEERTFFQRVDASLDPMFWSCLDVFAIRQSPLFSIVEDVQAQIN